MLYLSRVASPFRLCALLLCLLPVSQANAQSGVQISSDGDMLSIQASNVSASELAGRLSEHLGISVVVTGDTEARVNLDIVEEPIETALGKLSPNNLLVRNTQSTQIVEVILMMGEGSGSAEQFLPSGSPTEGVVTQPLQDDGVIQDESTLPEDNLSGRFRDAAERASSDPNLPAAQLPPMFGEDQTQSQQIDPATGLPYEN